MQHKWKRLISYYRPYRGLFFSDMVFAILGAAVTLAIPLIVRYITTTVVLLPGEEALQIILRLGAAMVAMVALECFCNFYIAYYGHIMGAKIEHDMRNEILSIIRSFRLRFLIIRRSDSFCPVLPRTCLISVSCCITDRRM